MRLIDADKIHPDVRTQRGALAISQGQLAYAETVNAILIPDNATNGDVIKAMFDTTEEHFYDEDRMVDVYGLDRSDDPSTFYADWWNALYKAGSEGK